MSKERKVAGKALLEMVVDPERRETVLEPSAFGQGLGEVLKAAVESMRADGTIEVEDSHLDALVAEVVEAGLDSRSPKQMAKRVIRTMLQSDHVEEIYGTDEMLDVALRRFLEAS